MDIVTWQEVALELGNLLFNTVQVVLLAYIGVKASGRARNGHPLQ